MSRASGGPARSTAREPVELVIGDPAAGGSCVAHAAGVTYFVRGGLPGERVKAVVTGQARGGRIRFARVSEVITASPHRVHPPCALAGSCGGCDLQHVARNYQLQWKSTVVRDQLQRIGGITEIGGRPLTEAVEVVAVEGDGDGLAWRTRYVSESDTEGHLGFHRYRSDSIVPTEHCPIVVPELQSLLNFGQRPNERWQVALGDEPTVWAESAAAANLPPGWRARSWHIREALGRRWRVATGGFWQAHRAAADLLGEQVRRQAAVRPDDVVVDLYAGVGLFAAAVSDAAQVIAVEGDERAIRLARRNLHDLPHITLVRADVRKFRYPHAADVSIADPPRAGAGPAVIDHIAEHTTRTIVHIGCDTANTARDLRRLHEHGWIIRHSEWFDLFPMTHHVESVTTLTRA